jgi:hypothetical protein
MAETPIPVPSLARRREEGKGKRDGWRPTALFTIGAMEKSGFDPISPARKSVKLLLNYPTSPLILKKH